MRQRGLTTGVPAAEQRLRTAERILADARANPKAMHHFSRLEANVAEAKRPPGNKWAVKIGRLATVTGVAEELGRLYRAARHGKIPSSDASRLASVLQILKGCLVDGTLEARMDELERMMEDPDYSNVVDFKPKKAG